jgi:hypothetical protein
MTVDDFQKLSRDDLYMFDIKGMLNAKEFKITGGYNFKYLI